MVDERGAVVDEVLLDWAKASVRPAQVGGRAAFLLEVDPQPDAGLYSGVTTYVVVVEGGKLHFLEAFDERGRSRRIALFRGAVADWRLDPDGSFLQVDSEFGTVDDGGDIPRWVAFRRISFEDGRWVQRERRDSTRDTWMPRVEGFPARTLFP